MNCNECPCLKDIENIFNNIESINTNITNIYNIYNNIYSLLESINILDSNESKRQVGKRLGQIREMSRDEYQEWAKDKLRKVWPNKEAEWRKEYPGFDIETSVYKFFEWLHRIPPSKRKYRIDRRFEQWLLDGYRMHQRMRKQKDESTKHIPTYDEQGNKID